jgi:ribosomal protein S18 acetylase RimI-like enzyme
MAFNIERLIKITKKEVQEISSLLSQLTDSGYPGTLEYLSKVTHSGTSILYVAREGGEEKEFGGKGGQEGEETKGSRIIGMATLGWYFAPTGMKAWLEDVVVDKAFRGRGIGEGLVQKALEGAREIGARRLDLTSNPQRIAARALYKKLGFQIKDTGLFRKPLS